MARGSGSYDPPETGHRSDPIGEPGGDATIPISDLDAPDLDDRADREELRQRYYGLLQELRVLLPGVQVLVAFLLTAPFAGRFEELDSFGKFVFGVAISGGLLAVVSFIVPTAFHRLGTRTARGARLHWSIRATVAGLGFLALSLTAALAVVARFVYGDIAAVVMTVVLAATIVTLWLVIPRMASTAALRSRTR